MHAIPLLLRALVIAAGIIAHQAHAAVVVDSPSKLTKPDIRSVSKSPDGKVLEVEFVQAGKTAKTAIPFPGTIESFAFSPWLYASGIAVAATIKNEEQKQFYWVATMFGSPEVPKPALIHLPERDLKLMGIMGSGGDSVVITFGKHTRSKDNPDTVSGYIYTDNCPCFTTNGTYVGMISIEKFETTLSRFSGTPPPPAAGVK